jgi:aryl-alcohol dehydrogenase-like predicted oxidoreductase
MEYRTLGASGFQVSPICLGTMTFGNPVPEADAVRLVHETMDLGVNFIDTADSYEGYDRVLGSAGGVSEQILGKALKGRRDRAVVATKVCAPTGKGPMDKGLSAVHIHDNLERSLRLLQTDYIDLYIIHWPDKLTPLEITLEAIERAVRQGKVRSFGASNHSDAQLCELLWIADRRGWPRVVASQIPFSLLQRNFQNELAFCARHDIAVTPYQPLQAGLLTGKYRRGQAPPDDSRAAENPSWLKLKDEMFDRLEALGELANEIGASMTQYALAWVLAQEAMASVVVGSKRIEQVKDAVGACELTIPSEHFARIDELCPPPWKQADPIRG